MKFLKKSLTQWVSHRCERQLALSLWTDKEQRADSDAGEAGLGIPHRQILPGLKQMADKGDDWQALKVADLMTVFGESTVLGARGEVVRNAPDGYRSAVFGASSLLDHLTSSPPPGTFIVEGGFAPRNGVFDKTWSLEWCADLELEWGELRPDIIQVADPGLFAEGLLPDGSICDLTGDDRVVLRVIDAKLSSEPGRGYYAEVAYYAVALAAWLNHMGLDDRYVVAAAPALWPGSHNQSALIEAWRADADGDELLEALNADLEECPIDVFIPELHRFFTQVLPRVARSAVSREWAQLPWHVVQSCSGCDYLGQRLPDGSKATGPSRPHANHCIPTARETDHVSMLPYVPRGGTTVLQEAGVTTTSNVALLSRDDPKLDEHHALRAGRAIIPARARTLTGQQPPGIGVADATTAAIPRRADLNLYITADFDPTSAITACFGVSGVYFPTWADQQNGAEPRFLRTAVYHVEARTLEEERTQLDLLLKQIDHQLTAAHGNNPEASFQLYLWDELTLKHLTRVIGRHLDWLLASGSAPRLAWLFPPEDQVLANPRFVQSPAVSVVADAVRSLVATDQPHAYTLLETAREYHSAREAVDERTFQAPAYWTTQLSDQLPGERIFELWNSDTQRFHTPKTQLIENLAWTVKAKHRALQAVVRRLREDLNGQLHREAPHIKHLQPPGSAGAMSYLGSLLVWYSKLNHAINLQETVRVRAMAPHEREARFATIYCEEFLTGDAAKDAAAHLNLSVVPGRRFYKMRPASAEVRAEVGDFTWFASPADNPELVHTSLYWAVREKGLLGEGWWVNKPPYLNSWESVLGVTIAALDRSAGLVALDMSHVDLVDGLVSAGLLDLDGACLVDRVNIDFLSRRIEDVAKAVGNPAVAAQHETELRAALGVATRGPRRTSASRPVHALLWSPASLHGAQVARPVAAIRPKVEAALTLNGAPSLNDDQWDAWAHSMTRRLTLIWGPPGTGKSRTVGAILDGYVIDAVDQRQRARILVTAATWKAIDNILVPFMSRQPGVPTFRPRSGAGLPPTGQLAAVDLNVDDKDELEDLVTALGDAVGPVVVACTPQQARKVVEAACGNAAGELFDVIVVDEAGRIDVGLALLSLAGLAEAGQVVIAGDPLQLPPIVAAEPPEHLAWMVGPLYSYFADGYQVTPHTLLTNYRSNAEIVELSKLAGYPKEFDARKRLTLGDPRTEPPPGWPESIDWDDSFQAIVDPERPVVCLTYPEGIAGQWNLFEADLVRALTALLAERLVGPEGASFDDWMWGRGLGIVTPHRAQRARIVAELQAAFPDTPVAAIRDAVDTVERFQGQERDVILASYAVGDPDTIAAEEEFLQDLNRFNVLATRPTSKLIVMVTDELVGHLAADIRTLRSSALLKQFTGTYCGSSAAIDVSYADPRRGEREVPLTLRWHT